MGQPLIWKKHYWIPPEHGAWFMWMGPLLTGILAARYLTFDLLGLTGLILAAFLARQPVTIVFKSLVGRRSRAEVRPASVAMAALGGLAIVLLVLMLTRGHAYLAWLGCAGAAG